MDPTQTDIASDVLRAIESSDWKYVASTVLAVAAHFLRGPAAKRVPFFGTDPGGVAFVTLLGAAGGLLNAFLAKWSLGTALLDPILGTTVLKVVGGAIAQYVVVKKIWPTALAETGLDSAGAAKVGMDAAKATVVVVVDVPAEENKVEEKVPEKVVEVVAEPEIKKDGGA